MYDCRILADSLASGVRLTTFQITFPRIVLAEFNTHRKKSRNSASSRAIPVQRQIQSVLENPFVPTYWGKNQKGMQAEEELGSFEQREAELVWLLARDQAVQCARQLLAIGVHKQITNRLLEPFMWHTVICTATSYKNFFALRCNPEAQPEIRTIAEMMREAYDKQEPRELRVGEWHLPLVFDEDRLELYSGREEPWETPAGWLELAKLSSARCARISYLTHDGRRAPKEDLALHDRLLVKGHMSPFEHAAVVADADNYVGSTRVQDFGNFDYPWVQYRKLIPNEAVFKGGA